jgi:hypothetical protein
MKSKKAQIDKHVKELIALLEEENNMLYEGYSKGKNTYNFRLVDALQHIEKAQDALEDYNYNYYKY